MFWIKAITVALIAMSLTSEVVSLDESDVIPEKDFFAEDASPHHHNKLFQELVQSSLSGKAHLDPVPGYTKGSPIHPELLNALKAADPLNAHQVFLDPKVPLSSLLGHPIGKVSCTEVAEADSAKKRHVKVEVQDLSRNPGTLMKTRKLNAEFLSSPDPRAATDTRTVILRGYRHEHVSDREKLHFPDADFVPTHLRGITLDPKADVMLEMMSNELEGDKCEFYLRHHREGVHALSSVLELDGRAHLKSLIHKFREDLETKMDDHLGKNPDLAASMKNMKSKDANKAVHELFQNAQKHMEAKKREQAAEKAKLFQAAKAKHFQEVMETPAHPDNLAETDEHVRSSTRRRRGILRTKFAKFGHSGSIGAWSDMLQCVGSAEDYDDNGSRMHPMTQRQVSY